MTTVRSAMLSVASTHGAGTTVDEARAALANPKVHMLLLTQDGRLLGTLVESDLAGAPGSGPALACARLGGRVVSPDAGLEQVHEDMVRSGVRRLAVVDPEGSLLGLLCLKRHQRGFCTDTDVWERRQAVR